MSDEVDIVRFPKNDSPITPWDLYQNMYPQFSSDILTYANGPISGGIAAHNTEWGIEERILYNREFALLVLKALGNEHLLPKGKVISAHMIGPRTRIDESGKTVPWSESDFLVFWAAIIARLPSRYEVALFHEHIHQNGRARVDALNNYHADYKDRKTQYDWFAQKAIDDIGQNFHHKIDVKITTPGATSSFGSQVEQQICEALGVRTANVMLDRKQSIKSNQPYVSHVLFRWLLTHPEHWGDVFTYNIAPLTLHTR